MKECTNNTEMFLLMIVTIIVSLSIIFLLMFVYMKITDKIEANNKYVKLWLKLMQEIVGKFGAYSPYKPLDIDSSKLSFDLQQEKKKLYYIDKASGEKKQIF